MIRRAARVYGIVLQNASQPFSGVGRDIVTHDYGVVMWTRRATKTVAAPFSSSCAGGGKKMKKGVGVPDDDFTAASAAVSAAKKSKTTPEQLIRAGESLEFEQAAEMIFSESRTRFGDRRTLGWDWHAWHFFCSLMPACLAYGLVVYSEVRRLKRVVDFMSRGVVQLCIPHSLTPPFPVLTQNHIMNNILREYHLTWSVYPKLRTRNHPYPDFFCFLSSAQLISISVVVVLFLCMRLK